MIHCHTSFRQPTWRHMCALSITIESRQQAHWKQYCMPKQTAQTAASQSPHCLMITASTAAGMMTYGHEYCQRSQPNTAAARLNSCTIIVLIIAHVDVNSQASAVPLAIIVHAPSATVIATLLIITTHDFLENKKQLENMRSMRYMYAYKCVKCIQRTSPIKIPDIKKNCFKR